MEQQDERYLILEQYRIYSDSKEKFIERQFATNRFFLILNICILIAIFIIETIAVTSKEQSMIVMSLIGIATTLMWWMNIDSYQLLIKIKYSKVLEYLETKLPEQPYQKEFVEYKEFKKNKNLVVFGDFQKVLALLITCIYIVIATVYTTNWIKLLAFQG